MTHDNTSCNELPTLDRPYSSREVNIPKPPPAQRLQEAPPVCLPGLHLLGLPLGDAGLGQARQLIGRGGRAFNAIAALGQPHTQRQPEPPTTEDAYGFLCHELIFMLDSHGFATIGAWRRSWVTGHGSWVSRNQPMADDR